MAWGVSLPKPHRSSHLPFLLLPLWVVHRPVAPSWLPNASLGWPHCASIHRIFLLPYPTLSFLLCSFWWHAAAMVRFLYQFRCRGRYAPSDEGVRAVWRTMMSLTQRGFRSLLGGFKTGSSRCNTL